MVTNDNEALGREVFCNWPGNYFGNHALTAVVFVSMAVCVGGVIESNFSESVMLMIITVVLIGFFLWQFNEILTKVTIYERALHIRSPFRNRLIYIKDIVGLGIVVSSEKHKIFYLNIELIDEELGRNIWGSESKLEDIEDVLLDLRMKQREQEWK